MKTIELFHFGSKAIEEALRCIPEKENIFPELSFWLGSVSLQESDRVRDFLKACEQGQLEEINKFSDIVENCLYAILAQLRTGKSYRLFVLQPHKDPLIPQNCVFTRIIEDFEVKEKQSKIKDLKLNPEIRVRDILKNILRFP